MENYNSLRYYADLLSMLRESKNKKQPQKFDFSNEITFEKPSGTVRIPEFSNGIVFEKPTGTVKMPDFSDGIWFEKPTGTVNIKETEALIKKKKNNPSNDLSKVRGNLLNRMKNF